LGQKGLEGLWRVRFSQRPLCVYLFSFNFGEQDLRDATNKDRNSELQLESGHLNILMKMRYWK